MTNLKRTDGRIAKDPLYHDETSVFLFAYKSGAPCPLCLASFYPLPSPNVLFRDHPKFFFPFLFSVTSKNHRHFLTNFLFLSPRKLTLKTGRKSASTCRFSSFSFHISFHISFSFPFSSYSSSLILNLPS